MSSLDAVSPRDSTSDTPPVFDLGAFERSGAVRRAELARSVDESCRTLGCFVVSGAGLPDSLVERTLRVSNEFFALPDDVKSRYGSTRNNPCFGWWQRSVDSETSVRLRETFEVGSYDNALALAEAGYDVEWMDRLEPIAWPTQVPHFRSTWTTYLAAMEDLGLRLLEVMATALQLQPNWFGDKFDRQNSYLAGTRYPVQFDAARRSVHRMGEHVDFGTLTIIRPQAGRSGLQVRTADGVWIDALAGPDQFVVCVSEQMTRWTNDRWRAAPHRVLSPNDREPGLSRTALAFYQHPNYDAELAAIPTCVSPDNPARYPVGRAGDLSQSRMNAAELQGF